VDDPNTLTLIGKLPAEMSEDYLKENYALLSTSEAELRKRKIGTLATIYPRAWVDPEAWSPDSDYRSQLTYLGRAYYNPGFYSSCFMTVQAALPVPKVIRSAL